MTRQKRAGHWRGRATAGLRRRLEVPDPSLVAELMARLDAAERRADEMAATLETLSVNSRHHGWLAHTAHDQATLLTSIAALRAVVAAHRFDDPPLITVVTPTHNRRRSLEGAVASLRAQTYPHWEHVVAVDRCADDTEQYVRQLAAGDPRVKFTVTDRGRCGAARNDALELAGGTLVTYLDDDNTFDPGWLSAVAWAFEAFPHLEALYGVLVVDHTDRLNRRGQPQQLPSLHLHPFNRSALMETNFADTGTIAHRAGTPESRFDDDLELLGDWEMFGRLCSVTTPLALPAPAVVYRTDSPDRLSFRHLGHPSFPLVRNRLGALLADDALGDGSNEASAAS
jgi:glycosyltransferase involved in cell wall biosynthesis